MLHIFRTFKINENFKIANLVHNLSIFSFDYSFFACWWSSIYEGLLPMGLLCLVCRPPILCFRVDDVILLNWHIHTLDKQVIRLFLYKGHIKNSEYLLVYITTALRKWGGAHQTSNHLPKPHI